MAKQEFLDNLRIARNLYSHPRVESAGIQVDPRQMEQTIARAAIWLTPKSVKGFNADDFPELGPPRQLELRAAVGDFLDVASHVPPAEPATPEQLARATAAFAQILSILEPYLPTPQEGNQLEAALKNVKFPPWITNWDYELGTDQDGEPIVWVTLFADESIAPRREFGRSASQINRSILNALSALGNNRWPHVRMRTALEHKTA